MRLRLLVWLVPVLLLVLLGWSVLRTDMPQLSFSLGPANSASSTAASEASEDISQAGPVNMSVSGDPELGRATFSTKCAVCHAVIAGQKSATGPALAGVFGRPAGTADSNYQFYSLALKKSGKIWDPATLEAFLADPSGFIPGTTMESSKIPQGLPDATERDNLVAYLASLH